jgi:hypothetical protein
MTKGGRTEQGSGSATRRSAAASATVRYVAILTLVVVTTAAYLQITRNEFILFDDDQYVTENIHVLDGLTFESVRWALTTGHAANWHPVTWLSHMADIEVFGLNPAGHHLTSLLLHIFNSVLVCLVLERLTGVFWPGACVAALFALHPLHVESVAWVAERKDLLSAFFWFLTMGAYAFYVEYPTRGRYAAVVAFFVFGLLSKPMVVTLPVVLLLLDYWPLGRLGSEAGRRPSKALALLLEKWPLLLLAVLSGVVTFCAQQSAGTVSSLEKTPLSARIANASVSYIEYIRKTFWPLHLAVFYPHPRMGIPAWQVLAAASAILGVTLYVIAKAERRPYLAVGWLWYLVTLVPVIGLVQVGSQSRADRYTYIPLIGVFIMMAWGAADALERCRYPRLFAALAAPVLIALSWATAEQVRYWKTGEILLRRTIEVTRNNWLAHNNLGVILERKGEWAEARSHFEQALTMRPTYAVAHYNLGEALRKEGRLEEAIREYEAALRERPSHGRSHLGLGLALSAAGRIEEAIQQYEMVLRADPTNEIALTQLEKARSPRERQ